MDDLCVCCDHSLCAFSWELAMVFFVLCSLFFFCVWIEHEWKVAGIKIALIPHINNTMTSWPSTLQVGNTSYIVDIIRSFRDQYSVRVKLPNHEGHLINIAVYPEVKDSAVKLKTEYAMIHTVNLPPCSEEDKGKESKNKDHTTPLVRAALLMVLKQCPWVRGFLLQDISTISTIKSSSTLSSGSTYVHLPALSICCTGKTWYERAFGAHLESRHEDYRYLIEQYMQSPERKPQSVSDFANCFWLESLYDNHALLERLRPSYDGTATLQEFFIALSDSCTANGDEFCSLVMPWANDMISHMLQGINKNFWLIPVDADAAALLQVQNTDAECEWGSWYHQSPPSRMVFPIEVLDA